MHAPAWRHDPAKMSMPYVRHCKTLPHDLMSLVGGRRADRRAQDCGRRAERALQPAVRVRRSDLIKFLCVVLAPKAWCTANARATAASLTSAEACHDADQGSHGVASCCARRLSNCAGASAACRHWATGGSMAHPQCAISMCRFVWSVCDMTDADTVAQVYELLTRNYVEDDDEMFRCSRETTGSGTNRRRRRVI